MTPVTCQNTELTLKHASITSNSLLSILILSLFQFVHLKKQQYDEMLKQMQHGRPHTPTSSLSVYCFYYFCTVCVACIVYSCAASCVINDDDDDDDDKKIFACEEHWFSRLL